MKDAGKKEYGSCVSTYLKAEVGGQGGRGDGLQRETRKGQDVLRRSIATVDSWGTDAEIDRRDTVKPEGLCIAKGPPPRPRQNRKATHGTGEVSATGFSVDPGRVEYSRV